MVRVSRLYRAVPGFRRVKRAWRSRGFGIHSPFAFRFITCVLREGSSYYAYDRLRQLAAGHSDFRLSTLVFRLVCEYEPANVILDPALPSVIAEAIRLADSRVGLLDPSSVTPASPQKSTRMLICEGKTLKMPDSADGIAMETLIDETFRQGGVVVALGIDNETYRRLTARMVSGMSFTNRCNAVFYSRTDLPRQDFEVNF